MGEEEREETELPDNFPFPFIILFDINVAATTVTIFAK